jgi:hypothetical protein
MATAIEFPHVVDKEDHVGLAQLFRPTTAPTVGRHAVMWRTHTATTSRMRIACAQADVDFQLVEAPWIRKIMSRASLYEHFEQSRQLRLTAHQAKALTDALSSAQLMTEDELRAREEQLQRETSFIE